MADSTSTTPTLVLVVPCYDEASRLNLEAFRAHAANCRNVRFLFVDDGSKDDTATVIGELCDTDPAIFQLHQMPRNSGKAEAVRTGMLLAVDQEPEFVGFWDADLSTPLDELEPMLRVFQQRPEIDMVFAARVNLLGRQVRRKLMRHYIGRLFATVVSRGMGLGVYDTQCGAKLFRANDRLKSLLQEPFLSKWIFDVEIIAREIRSRRGTEMPPVEQSIYEHPLMQWYDVEGSKLRFRDFFIVASDFVRIYHRYFWRR